MAESHGKDISLRKLRLLLHSRKRVRNVSLRTNTADTRGITRKHTDSHTAKAQARYPLGIESSPKSDYRDGKQNTTASKKFPKPKKGNPDIVNHNIAELAKTDPERAREIRSMGGKAAAEQRRTYGTMKTCMRLILDTNASNFEGMAIAKEMGFTDAKLTYRMLLNVAIVRRALAGSVAAYREICDLVGEGIMSDGEDEGAITIHIQGRAKSAEPDDDEDE